MNTSSLSVSLLRSAVLALALLAPLLRPSVTQGQEDIRPTRVEWILDGLSGAPGSDWYRLIDAAIVRDRILAVDIGSSLVRVFDLDGNYLGEAGGAGSGPGEFARPSTAITVGDSVRIYDIALDRYSLFGPEAGHVRTARVEGSQGAAGPRYLHSVWMARHGWNFGLTGLVGRSTPGRSVPENYALAWRSDTPVDTLATFDGRPFWSLLAGDDSLNMSTARNLGSAGGIEVIGDSILVEIDGVRSVGRVSSVSPSGPTLTRTVELPGSTRPMSESDRELAQRWYRGRYGIPWDRSRDPDDLPDYHLVEAYPPPTWPAWSKVERDGEYIWLRRGGPRRVDMSRGELWLRWSIAGDSFLWVELPPGMEAYGFRDDLVVGMTFEQEFGTESLMLARIEGL